MSGEASPAGSRSQRRALVLSYLAAVGTAALLSLGLRSLGFRPDGWDWIHLPLTVAVGIPLGGLIQRWLARRRVAAKVVECALRPVLGGSPTSRWRHGRFDLSAGVPWTLTPYGPGGFRFPRGQPRSFPVESISADEGRRVGWRSLLVVDPSLHVVAVRSAGEDWELAASPEDLQRLRESLAGST